MGNDATHHGQAVALTVPLGKVGTQVREPSDWPHTEADSNDTWQTAFARAL